jgi:hypothetical protein
MSSATRAAMASGPARADARAHGQAEGDVVAHPHVRKERVVLEDEADAPVLGGEGEPVLAVDLEPPGVGPLEPGHDLEERGLARARGAEQRHELAVATSRSMPRRTSVRPKRLVIPAMAIDMPASSRSDQLKPVRGARKASGQPAGHCARPMLQ